MRKVWRVLALVLVCGVAQLGCPKTPGGGSDDDDSGQTTSSSSSSGGTGESSSTGGESSSGPVASSGVSGDSSGQASSTEASSSSGETCTDDCAANSQVCDGTDGYRVCGTFDADSCLDLSPHIACGQGYTCQDGYCVLPCQDECPANSSACDSNGNVLTCGNYDTDACRELGGASPCQSNYHCESGACVPDAAGCTDECAEGQSVCFGDSTRACGQFDGDSCRDLGPPVACNAGQFCQDGACKDRCTSTCTQDGKKECVANAVRTCGDHNGDGCLEWDDPVACGGALLCDQGACVTSCTDECPTVNETTCTTDGTGTHTCGQYDADSCRDYSSVTPCGPNMHCVGTGCVPTCTDECQAGDPSRCGADGHSVETCANHDADACLEYGGAVACPDGVACQDGACITPCMDECTPAASKGCAAANAGVITCGQYDTDACLEWSSASACQPYEVCNNGACDLGPTPGAVVINELVYDPAGGDTALGTLMFLELWGPAGLSLDGYSVVGVNGTGGTNAGTVTLDGESIGGDGFFVISHPNAAQSLKDVSDLSSTVDWQNGPDSVQVRWHTRVVDALGYGTFTASDVFAGEGNSAPAASAGKGLTRNAAHADTNDNRADFSVTTTPTPRANPSTCTDTCTTLNATQCSGTQVQTCLVAADGCRAWTTPANCPTAGEVCQGTACTATCTNACPTLNATQCSGAQIQTCVNGPTGCRDWSAAANCTGAHEACQSNVCTVQCTDTCTTEGAKQCSGSQIQTCVTGGNGCRAWTTAADCPTAGEVCQNNACIVPCTDHCPAVNATQCSGMQVQTCVLAASGCRDWGAATACTNAGEVCLNNTCQVSNAPEVRLITPQGTLQTTQGAQHRMLVDATPAAGRSIAEVRYFADSVQVGFTTASPHEFYFTVPAAAPTNSTITLQAKAVDNLGAMGASAPAYLSVKNDVPLASFTATVTAYNTSTHVGTVTVDASAVSDRETASSALEVCWDWDNNGSCDTAFSTVKIATHDYTQQTEPETRTIRMVVRDAVGQTAEVTRQVTMQSIQYVGGSSLNTTTWYGTVIITGDVTVAAGQTLTIQESTQVLFIRADANNDGIGDYTLDVAGALVVNGSAAAPVVFSGQNTTAKVPGAWDRILLRGAGSQIHNAIVEYADVGIEARSDVVLDNVTVRSVRWDCIDLNNADNASLTDVTVTRCGQSGLYVHNGSAPVTVTRFSSTQNGANGVWADGASAVSMDSATVSGNGNYGVGVSAASFNLANATVENNTKSGLLYASTATGTVTHNQVRQNGWEGVGLVSDAGGEPNPAVTFNNIYSNATAGAFVGTSTNTSTTLTASVTCCSSSYTYSGTWNAPAGKTIRRLYASYSEADSSSNYVQGSLQTGAGAELRHFDSTWSGWIYPAAGNTSLRVAIRDSNWSSATDTLTVTQVETVSSDGAVDISALTTSGTVDLRTNYLGTFPNVLSRVSMTRPDALNLQGFVGVPFDSTWATGPYKAGNQATQTWSGTVYVTGDVGVPAGAVLTVAPGTQVLFVKHDQDGDGQGDFSLNVDGRLDVGGSVSNHVSFTGYGSVSGDAFQAINLRAASPVSTWTYADVSQGKNAVTARGPHALSHLTIQGGSGQGITATGAGALSLTDVAITGAGGDGVQLSNTDGAVLTRVSAETCGRHGFLFTSGSDSVTVAHATSRLNGGAGMRIEGGSSPVVTDSTLRENTGDGAAVVDSAPTLDFNLVSYNHGAGLWFEGPGGGQAHNNVIKFNDDSGVVVRENATAGSPTPTVQYSNIVANAVVASTLGRVTATASPLTASVTCCSSSYTYSSTWTAPANTTIRRMYVTYSEADSSSNYVQGSLQNGGGTELRHFDSSWSGWIYPPAGTTTLRVAVRDSNWSSATDTLTVTQVETEGRLATDHYEMTVTTTSGTTNAQYNYWAPDLGDVPGKIFDSRPGSGVNYQGFTGAEYPSGSVTQVGPRP